MISDKRPSLIRQGATKIVDFGISKVYLFADSTIKRQGQRCYDGGGRGALPVAFCLDDGYQVQFTVIPQEPEIFVLSQVAGSR